MDKYEYSLKLDQIKSLVADENYAAAAEIADSINWNKIRNVNALVKAGEVYEKVERYQDSREILLMAYDRSPIGRMIIYRLAEVAIKMGDFIAAEDYYNEFVEIAPHDNLRYVLKYSIKKGQGVDISELIPILEEFKEQEYTEEWAYELAYLYHKAGQSEKCIEACDELILWFGDGPYVERALELKMLYQPLSKTQEEKYRRFRQEREGKTAIAPEHMVSAGEFAHDPVVIPKVEVNPDRFNTLNLQAEIAKGMQQIMDATEKTEVSDTMDSIKKIVEDIPYLQLPKETEAPVEEDVHIATDEEIDGSLKLNFQEFLGEDSDGQISLMVDDKDAIESQITGQITIQDILDEWEKTRRAAEAALYEADQQKLESAKARALQEAGDIMDRLTDVIPKLDAGYTPKELLEAEYMKEQPQSEMPEVEQPEAEQSVIEQPVVEQPVVEEIPEVVVEPIPDLEPEMDEKSTDDDSESKSGGVGLGAGIGLGIGAGIGLGAAAAQGFSKPDIKPGFPTLNIPYFSAQDSMAGVHEIHPVEDDEPEVAVPEEEIPKPVQMEDRDVVPEMPNVGVTLATTDLPSVDDLLKEAVGEIPVEPADVAEEPEAIPEDTVIPEVSIDMIPEVEIDLSEAEESPAAEEPKEEPEEIPEVLVVEQIDPVIAEITQQPTAPLPDLKDFALDEKEFIESIENDEDPALAGGPSTEEEIKELEQEVLLQPTEHLPQIDLDSDSDSDIAQTKKMPEIKKEIKPNELPELEDLDTPEEEIEAKQIESLTKEQRAIFSYFIPVKGMEEQLVNAYNGVADRLAKKQVASTGNLVIKGEKGCGKTVLATSFIKLLQSDGLQLEGKVGKIEAQALNQKDPQLLVRKVSGGCLIIEGAGDLTAASASALAELMKHDINGTVYILEDTSKGIKKALSLDPEFAAMFTEEITVPIFNNDELVAFAKSYSKELGYKIDEMAVLALHNRISNIQRLDQATTLTEVKEIVDEAIEKESKGGMRKALSILTAKRYTDDDRIVLTERHFEVK